MGFLAMVQTPGGGHGTSMRPPVAQNVSLRSLVGNQVTPRTAAPKEMPVRRMIMMVATPF
jgi:hypothetical protein